ncbi:Cu/Zn superoxide dismutase [Coprinopsis sp. MPI-PUGE-AT-0042]|nr:Cu/Zn superoxide dismutase [Coprinopsis sp. MPI-PUGE-AT-0042]
MQPSKLFAFMLASFVVPSYATFWYSPFASPVHQKAVVVLKASPNSTTNGFVYFQQDYMFGPVKITGNLTGLDANALRGFHVHQSGDLSGGCATAGPHFNPGNKTHGAPEDKVRHVGDLGNVQSNAEGTVILDFKDSWISLNGPNSIIGRAVVLHAGQDDLGKGGHNDSLTTGHAGARSACGVVAIV